MAAAMHIHDKSRLQPLERAMGISSPTSDRGKTIAEDRDESGSDVDLDDLRMFDEKLM